MSVAERSYALHILADIRKYQEEFAKIPGYTDKQAAKAADKLVANMSKASAEVGKNAQAAAGKAVSAFNGLGDSAGRAGQSAKKLRGALSLLGPEAVTMAGAIDDAGDVVEVFSDVAGMLNPIVLGLGAAVTVGAAAYGEFSRRSAAAAASLALQKEAGEQQIAIEKALGNAVLKNAFLRGEMTEAEYAGISAADTADQLFRARKDALIKRINDEQVALAASAASLAQVNERMSGLAARTETANAASREFGSSTQANERSIGNLTDQVEAHREEQRKLGAELGNVTLAEQKYAQVLQENEALEGKRTSAVADLTAAQNQHAEALAKLAGIQKSAEDSQLTGQAKILANQREQLANIEAIAAAEIADATTTEEAAAIRMAADEAAAAVRIASIQEQEALQAATRERTAAADDAAREKADAKKKEQDDKDKKKARDIADAKKQIAADSAQALVDITEFIAEKTSAGGKKAAMAAFVVAKLAAVARAGVNTYLAISNALTAAPPPFNFALAAAAGVAGGIAAAKVASAPPPSFHVGTAVGVRGNRTGEVAITAQEGELMVRRDAGRRPENRAAVARMNAGLPIQSTSPALVVDRYGGRLWARSLRDAARIGPLTTELNRGRRTGHFIPRGK